MTSINCQPEVILLFTSYSVPLITLVSQDFKQQNLIVIRIKKIRGILKWGMIKGYVKVDVIKDTCMYSFQGCKIMYFITNIQLIIVSQLCLLPLLTIKTHNNVREYQSVECSDQNTAHQFNEIKICKFILNLVREKPNPVIISWNMDILQPLIVD